MTPQKITTKEDKNIATVYVSSSPILWQQTKKLFEYTTGFVGMKSTDQNSQPNINSGKSQINAKISSPLRKVLTFELKEAIRFDQYSPTQVQVTATVTNTPKHEIINQPNLGNYAKDDEMIINNRASLAHAYQNKSPSPSYNSFQNQLSMKTQLTTQKAKLINIIENENQKQTLRDSTKVECDMFESLVATQTAWNNFVLVTTKTANDDDSWGEPQTCRSRLKNELSPTINQEIRQKNPNLSNSTKFRNVKSAGNQEMLNQGVTSFDENIIKAQPILSVALIALQKFGNYQNFVDVEYCNKQLSEAPSKKATTGYLRSINMSQNSLQNIQFILNQYQSNAKQLLILNLYKNSINSLEFVQGCINIQFINLGFNKLENSSDIFYLMKLQNLQELYLNNNKIDFVFSQPSFAFDKSKNVWPHLLVLDISNNTTQDPKQLQIMCLSYINTQRIKCLNFSSNPCSQSVKRLLQNYNFVLDLPTQEVVVKFSEYYKHQRLAKVCFTLSEPIQSLQNRLIYLLNPSKKQPQTVMPVISSFSELQLQPIQESAPTTIIQEESPPFKAMHSPKIDNSLNNANQKNTMKSWLNTMVPLKLSKPLADGIQARKIDNQTNIEDLDKTLFTSQEKPKRCLDDEADKVQRQSQNFNPLLTPEQPVFKRNEKNLQHNHEVNTSITSKQRKTNEMNRFEKIGPGKGNNKYFRMVQLAPSGYNSRRSSSIPSAATSSRQSLQSKGRSNSSDKLQNGVLKAYNSSCGVTSINSNYGPHFQSKALPDQEVAEEKKAYQTENNHQRSRSVSSISQKSKKAFASISNYRNNISDDHNIYHQKSITRKQQSSLS